MKIKDIYRRLDEISPFEVQESWDNSGLLVGEFESEVKKIYISLDIDESVIEKIDQNSLLITHHPLIFKPLKDVVGEAFSKKFLKELIKKDISLISMHTNFDKTHLNKFFAEKVLGFEGLAEDFVYYVDLDIDFDELVDLVKKRMNLNTIRVVKAKEKIKKIAITTGSGMGLLNLIKADCFLTGDIKYHEAMDAKARGINLIDIEHFHSEKYFVDALFEEIKNWNIEIIKINSKNPFEFI